MQVVTNNKDDKKEGDDAAGKRDHKSNFENIEIVQK